MSAPSNQDLIGGFDPTAQVNITGADLLAIVQSGTPYSDKGLVVVTTDVGVTPEVPNALVTTKWQNYLWVRRLTSSVIVYAWNPSAATDGTYEKWQQIDVSALADYSVTNTKIAPNAVTDDKIFSVSYTKVTGGPTGLPPSGDAGGDLTGTYPNPTIGSNAVDDTKLASSASVSADRAVTGNHIRDNAVDPATHLKVSDTAAFQIMRLNSGATAWEYVYPGTIQAVYKSIFAGDNNVTAISGADSAPVAGAGTLYISNMMTTKLATSLIRVRFACRVSSDTNDKSVAVALYVDGTSLGTTAKQVTAVHITAATDSIPAVIDYVLASPGAGVALTITIRYGLVGTTGAPKAYMNQSSSGHAFGGAGNSILTIEEITGTLTAA